MKLFSAKNSFKQLGKWPTNAAINRAGFVHVEVVGCIVIEYRKVIVSWAYTVKSAATFVVDFEHFTVQFATFLCANLMTSFWTRKACEDSDDW